MNSSDEAVEAAIERVTPDWDDAALLAEDWGCVQWNDCWLECLESAAHELGVSP